MAQSELETRMSEPPATSAASRLCGACGLCCNGVLFHTVRLQPGDSARELAALGLKLKRKKRRDYILQPCPAWRDSQCSIYLQRPERCRLFECRQLQRVAAGEISEAAALEKIRDVQARVETLHGLLQRAGSTNARRPLARRCEKILAEPSLDEAGAALREEIARAMRELDALLDRDFRIAPESVEEPDAQPTASR